MNWWENAAVWLPGVAAMTGLALVSGFCSGAETAMFYLSRDEVRQMRMGRPRQRLAVELLRDPDRLLTAVLFWNLIVNMTYFAVSVIIARRLILIGETTAAGLLSFGSLGAIVIVGEVIPKSLAVLFRRSLAEWAAWPLSLLIRALDPVMPAMSALTRGIRRGLYPNLKREPFLDADDLERALETLPQGQSIDPYERTVLHRILDLSEITAEELMRPRGRYAVLKPPASLAQAAARCQPTDYLYIQDNERESIRAAVPLHSLPALPAQRLETAADPVTYVPWCSTVADVLQRMHEESTSVAVVVSEYGEAVGVLTEEDLLDSVFAPQPSRGKRLLNREPVLVVGDGVWHVDGITTLRYLATRLGLDYDPDQDDAVTVGGLLQEQLERFPREGDECLWRGYRFRVFDAPGRGQLRAIVVRAETPLPEPSVAPRPAESELL